MTPHFISPLTVYYHLFIYNSEWLTVRLHYRRLKISMTFSPSFFRENHEIKFTPQYFGTVSSSIQHTLDVQWMLSSHEQGSELQAIADRIHYWSQWQDGLPLTNILFRDPMEISTFHGSFSLPQSVFISIDGPCIFYSWLQSWLPIGFTTSIYELVNILLSRNSDHWRICFKQWSH